MSAVLRIIGTGMFLILVAVILTPIFVVAKLVDLLLTACEGRRS